MNKENKIEKINISSLFGVFIECGCGACTISSIYDVEGASRTVYYSSQPYDKQYQLITYPGSIGSRSVSYEFVNDLLAEERDKNHKLTEKINFIFASSFQLQGKNQSNLTHGWLGLEIIDIDQFTNTREFYHLSIPEKLERKEYLEIISEISVDLLYSKTDKDFKFTSEYIDNIKTIEFKADKIISVERDHKKLLEIVNSIEKDKENFIVFNEHLNVIRFEDLCRDKEGVILVKGTFNPIHEQHVKLMEESMKLYPTYSSAFHISIGNRDKKEVNVSELLERIIKITGLGYNIVISKQAMFNSNVCFIRKRWRLPVIFPVGYDTINRFIDDTMRIDAEVFDNVNNILYKEEDNKKRTKEEIVDASAFRFFYKDKWKNSKFLVFHRLGYDLHEDANYFKDLIQLEGVHRDEFGISSTKIRNGELKSKL